MNHLLTRIALLFLACLPVHAQDESITVPATEEVLRYGGDLEGGVPYVFNDPEHPGKLIGFEVEIIEAIAARLGRKAVFVQNDWDKLIPGLNRDLYDIAIHGQEITPEHEEAVAFTVPYYITSLQLCVRRDEFLINDLDDCHGKVVGTLKESGAYYILESLGDVDIRAYNTEVNGFDDLERGRLSATLFDAPVAQYYGRPRDGVKFVGPPISRIVYGFAVAEKNQPLLSQVDAALQEMKETGELRAILERWGLWNELTANEFGDFSASHTAAAPYEAWLARQQAPKTWRDIAARYAGYVPIFARAAWVTIQLSVCGMVLAIVLGFGLALVRLYAPAPFSWMAVAYIELVRGTPLLIQLMLLFYGLPSFGISLSPMVAGIAGLALNYAAYEAENYRAGFQSVPRAQMESALALGMTRWQAIRHVIAPQALRFVLPPLTNDFISLLKDSSLVSVITLVELTKAYGQVSTTYYDYFGTGIMVALVYLLLGLPFVRLARWFEKRLHLPHLPMHR